MKPSNKALRRIAELTAILAPIEISEANGATPQKDDYGKTIENWTTCGTCRASWNDALITGTTPAPSGRCPYEYYHAEIIELRGLKKLCRCEVCNRKTAVKIRRHAANVCADCLESERRQIAAGARHLAKCAEQESRRHSHAG